MRPVTGGTDTHLALLDLQATGVTGTEAEARCDAAGIVLNKNAIPNDPRPASVASGIRVGTPSVTTQGMGAAQMALAGLAEETGQAAVKKDLMRVQESALAIYSMVHEQLTARHFSTLTKSPSDELHRIRHDLRNLLQNVLLRCEMVAEEDTLPEVVREELTDIRRSARDCVAVLNSNRDAATAEDGGQ